VRRSVAILYRGDGDPPAEAWSGIPSGLAGALSELGFGATMIDAEPPRYVSLGAKAWAQVVRGDRRDGLLAPEIVKLRELTARARARRHSFDACVQMGSDFGLPIGGRRVTFEDMTVTQAIKLPGAEGRLKNPGAWIARQRASYESAHACCVASRWCAASVVDDYGVDPAKVHVVGFGRHHEPVPHERDWDPPRFLFVGLDWERKNGPVLLRAFARLRDERPAAQLHLAGEVPRIDVDGVTVHGRLDRRTAEGRARMVALYAEATCFVMPSKYEPFGMVYVEAGAAGIPSIGTAVGGAPDAIGDGGLVVQPSDEEALLVAMRELAEPERAAAAGRRALQHAQLFTWPRVAERVVRALALPESARRSLAPFL
jgi:glycosyltransferase involved in cell wall biosynthesis